MAESGGNGPRDPLTRFLPHNIQEPRPSIKPALLPSQPCVALNFAATGCRLDSSVITIKPDELSTVQGPVRRQDPLGKKAAHLTKPVLPFSRAGPVLPAWLSGPTRCSKLPSTLFIPKKEGWRSPVLLLSVVISATAHPRVTPASLIASSSLARMCKEPSHPKFLGNNHSPCSACCCRSPKSRWQKPFQHWLFPFSSRELLLHGLGRAHNPSWSRIMCLLL